MMEDYLSMIEAILGSPIEDEEITIDLEWNSIQEARQHVRQINQTKKELRLVRNNIRQVMKEIRVSFREGSRRGRSCVVKNVLLWPDTNPCFFS